MSATDTSGLPVPVDIFSPEQIASRYGFPQNLGEGVIQGIFAIGKQGGIGIDLVDVSNSIQKLNSSYLPVFRVIPIGDQINNQNIKSGELQMDAVITGYYVPKAESINIYISTEERFCDAVEQAAADGCWVTTCSYGIHEQSLLEEINVALGNAASLGMTACFASGDSGAASGYAGNGFDGGRFPRRMSKRSGGRWHFLSPGCKSARTGLVELSTRWKFQTSVVGVRRRCQHDVLPGAGVPKRDSADADMGRQAQRSGRSRCRPASRGQ